MSSKQDHFSESFIFLRSGDVFEKVSIEDITHLKADGSYSKFITAEKDYLLSGNLDQAYQKLKNPLFLRIHRSYVVNIKRVTGLDATHVFIDNLSLPIGRSYKRLVNQQLRKIS